MVLQELKEYQAEAHQSSVAEAMHIAEMSQLNKVPAGDVSCTCRQNDCIMSCSISMFATTLYCCTL